MTKLRLNVMNSESETTESSRVESSDYETDTYYYRARYYDPQAGRFLTEDPARFGAATDFYPYVANRPVDFVDAFGLCPKDPKKCYGEARVIGAARRAPAHSEHQISRAH